jgi:small subunit ribosomal protein S3
VFKGEIMAHDPMAHDKRAEEAAPQRTPARVDREQRDA